MNLINLKNNMRNTKNLEIFMERISMMAEEEFGIKPRIEMIFDCVKLRDVEIARDEANFEFNEPEVGFEYVYLRKAKGKNTALIYSNDLDVTFNDKLIRYSDK
jgi:hypothetical protein